MKGVLMMIVWTMVLLALSISLRCQEIPDTPMVSSGSGCTLTIIGDTGRQLSQPVPCQTIWRVVPPPSKKVTYWTFRRSWQDPSLRTNKQQLKSKAYYLSALLGDTAMIVACVRHHTSQEEWGSEVPASVGVDAMAFIGGKYFTQSFAVGPQIYKIIHYSISAGR